jgi:hypothetical protein
MADAVSEIAAYLDTSERVLWSSVPARGILFRTGDAFLIPFGIFWLAFVLFWEAGALAAATRATDPAPLLFALFGLPFIAIGLYLVVGRFLWDADVRGGTTYALTNRRAIILRRVPTKRFRSIGLTSGTEISTTERRDGSGTIYFGPRLSAYSLTGWPMASADLFVFERIRGAREAMRVVRTIQQGAK